MLGLHCPISIITSFDPLVPKVGGVETFTKGFVKYAPEDFYIRFIGISSNYKERPSKKWTKLSLGDKKFDFYSLFLEKDENRKALIPLSIRFSLALKFSKIEINKEVLFFNRIEHAIAFKKLDTPKIVVIHNDIIKQIKSEKSEVLWSKFPWLYFMFENFIFKSLDTIYTVSGSTLEFYKLRYPKNKNKFLFLPTWVDAEIFYPLNMSKEKIKQKIPNRDKLLSINGKWILFVGRLQAQKAPLRLMQTFAEYHKINKDSHLIIIGEGNLKRKIIDFVRELGLIQSVFFLGVKDQLELADYYRAADVMLLTSNFEGMPMCVLEALGCGLPVVTTDVGEVKRVVKNGVSGEVVDSFSPRNISQSLMKVLNNPSMYSKDNCLEAVAEYSPKKVFEPVYNRIRKLYKEKYVI